MGVTISHAIGIQTDRVKDTLDRTEKIANIIKKEQADKIGISFDIERRTPEELAINIDGCETLMFSFDTFENYRGFANMKGMYSRSYEYNVLKDRFSTSVLETENNEHLKRWPGQRLLWSADFCKTQYAGSGIQHRWVAELTRSVAQVASYAHVSDEADYYHTNMIDDIADGIAENAKVLDQVAGDLKKSGWTA